MTPTTIRNYTFLLLLTTLILSSCGNKNKEQSENGDSTSESREPTDDELREYGKVVSIEDGAYPMFSITVDFPRLEMQRSFGFNVEESPLDAQGLAALEGKEVEIFYTSELENMILDAVFECESVLGDEHAELEPGTFSEVTGMLSGAEGLSGDLPTEITITDSAGEQFVFEEFVTAEMMAVNGEEITVYYYVREVDMITHLREVQD